MIDEKHLDYQTCYATPCAESPLVIVYFAEFLYDVSGDDWDDTPASSNASPPSVSSVVFKLPLRLTGGLSFNHNAFEACSVDYINGWKLPWIYDYSPAARHIIAGTTLYDVLKRGDVKLYGPHELFVPLMKVSS
jgi:hypothetical protein